MAHDINQSEIDAMREEMDKARQEEQALLDMASQVRDRADKLLAPVRNNPEPDGITPQFVKSCLDNNERGDGVLFAAIHRGRFVHVKNTGLWLAWQGHHYEVDKKDLVSNGVEDVAGKYLEQADYHRDLAKKSEGSEGAYHEAARKLYMKRVTRLRSNRGVKTTIEFTHKIGEESLAIIGDELDQKPWFLPCKNGVINLKTGVLMNGRPVDLLVKAIPIEFKDIREPCPTWEKFINEIHQDDPAMVSFLRRLLGYAITGLTTEHFIACFVGDGRNGKGTMFSTLQKIMGDLAWSVQPELILEQKNSRSSAGPSPDLISLQGRRIVIAAETDENRRISGAKVKNLSGGDIINARAPHDRFETNFIPTHTLFLHTNHIPKGLTKDFALLKRLLFINYPLKFIDDPKEENERQRDPGLLVKLEAEASGILAWLVKGCLEWQEYGLSVPEKIRADVDQLRISEDPFQQFFNECCTTTESHGYLLFKDIYDRFSNWYADEIDESKRYIPTKKAVGAWLEKNGVKKDKKGGQAIVIGVSMKRDDDV